MPLESRSTENDDIIGRVLDRIENKNFVLDSFYEADNHSHAENKPPRFLFQVDIVNLETHKNFLHLPTSFYDSLTHVFYDLLQFHGVMRQRQTGSWAVGQRWNTPNNCKQQKNNHQQVTITYYAITMEKLQK